MNNTSRWTDTLSLVFSGLVVSLTSVWLLQNGSFNTSLAGDSRLTWYLIRASGTTAYVLLTLSVLWGLAVSSSVVKDWSPGPLSMVLHSTISWLGLIFGLGHGLLLLFDDYFSYHLADIFVPFTGPYRPVATGLGTLTFWLLLIVTPSFALKKRLFSHQVWKKLHYTSYAAFLMATVHGLTAGTDAGNMGFQALFGGSVLLTVILLGYRIGAKQSNKSKTSVPRHTASQIQSRETT